MLDQKHKIFRHIVIYTILSWHRVKNILPEICLLEAVEHWVVKLILREPTVIKIHSIT